MWLHKMLENVFWCFGTRCKLNFRKLKQTNLTHILNLWIYVFGWFLLEKLRVALAGSSVELSWLRSLITYLWEDLGRNSLQYRWIYLTQARHVHGTREVYCFPFLVLVCPFVYRLGVSFQNRIQVWEQQHKVNTQEVSILLFFCEWYWRCLRVILCVFLGIKWTGTLQTHESGHQVWESSYGILRSEGWQFHIFPSKIWPHSNGWQCLSKLIFS